MPVKELLRFAAIDIILQWICWTFAAELKTEKFFDLAGACTFVMLVYMSYEHGSTRHFRQTVQTSMVVVWAFRLGIFLFTRVMNDGRDRRMDKAKESPLLFFVYWTLQGVWVFVTLLPTMLLNMEKQDVPIGWRDYIGWGLWSIGLVIEYLADDQKSRFRKISHNKDKFIRSGLWSISRHPNYLGEIMMWFGLFISASSVFRHELYYLTILCPVFDALLITKMSGIPPLEAHAERKWGTSQVYQNYKKNTAVLMPYIW